MPTPAPVFRLSPHGCPQACFPNAWKNLKEVLWHGRCSNEAMTSARLAERSIGNQHPRHTAGAARPGVRSQNLEASHTEFAEKVFQEASLAAIARRLGVTAPLVLYHFGSKANLWREALEVFCANFAAVVEKSIEDSRELDGRES